MGVALPGLQAGLLNQSSAQVIDGSLKFDDDSLNYLSRTPSSVGNRNTWTLSWWMKRSRLSNNFQTIFGVCDSGASYYTQLRLGSADKLSYQEKGSANGPVFETSMVFRDTSAWYHCVFVFNNTAASNDEKARLYVNGSEITSFSTDNRSQIGSTATAWNNNVQHNISHMRPYSGNFDFDGQISNVYLIDAQALGPENFGFTDPLTNTWRPKKYEGTFTQTSFNNGTTWSSSLTSNGTLQNAGNAFDGDLSSRAQTQSPAADKTLTFAPPAINFTQKLEVYCDQGSAVPTATWNGNTVNPGGGAWVTVYTGSGTLSSTHPLVIDTETASQYATLKGVRIDGEVLIDGLNGSGVNSFYLPMDNDDFHIDKSGKGNNWTKQNFSGTSIDPDVLKDSPSGAVSGGRAQTGITTTSSAPSNYPTLNPLSKGSRVTLTNGNLELASSASSGNAATMEAYATFTASSGKFYAEVTNSSNRTASVSSGTYSGASASIYSGGGSNSLGGTASGSGASFTTSDFLAVAIDFDDKNVYFYKNNTLIYSVTGYTTELDLFFADRVNSSGSTGTSKWNFGQKPFKYAPPQGFLPLNSASARPETVIKRPDQFVGVTTYTSNNNTLSVSDYQFQPDLLIFKNRDTANHWGWFDSVRGANKQLSSNRTNAESTTSGDGYGTGTMNSFDRNGFTLGNDVGSNVTNYPSGDGHVVYGFNAGGNKNTFNVDDVGYASAAAAGLDGGSITPTGASVGTRQGFSIVKWTATNGAAIISHGLKIPPTFIVVKDIDSSTFWQVYHSSLGNTKAINLNSANEASTATNHWNNTSPTSTTFSVGLNSNYLTEDHIAYIWHDVPGLQKFGSYAGSSGTTFVNLGFRPALLVIKFYDGTDVGSHAGWKVIDNQRNKFNISGIMQKVAWDVNEAENGGTTISTSEGKVDFLSNGFRILDNHSPFNTSGRSYIYMAWAEAPASNLYGGQSNAR